MGFGDRRDSRSTWHSVGVRSLPAPGGSVEPTSVELNVLRGVASVLAVLVVVSAVVTLAARDTVEEADRVDAIEVLMEKTEFRTAELDAKAGETLRLVIKNNDL